MYAKNTQRHVKKVLSLLEKVHFQIFSVHTLNNVLNMTTGRVHLKNYETRIMCQKSPTHVGIVRVC